MGTRCANHVTPLYPQKLELTSPTGCGRSVGMVRSRTKATEFSLVLVSLVNVCIMNKIYILPFASGGISMKIQQTLLQPKLRRTHKNKCEQLFAERG